MRRAGCKPKPTWQSGNVGASFPNSEGERIRIDFPDPNATGMAGLIDRLSWPLPTDSELRSVYTVFALGFVLCVTSPHGAASRKRKNAGRNAPRGNEPLNLVDTPTAAPLGPGTSAETAGRIRFWNLEMAGMPQVVAPETRSARVRHIIDGGSGLNSTIFRLAPRQTVWVFASDALCFAEMPGFLLAGKT